MEEMPMEINIGDVELKKRINIGNVEVGVKKIFPELENLEVTPSLQQQTFKSNMYGYNIVNVKEIQGKELTVIPTMEEQVNEGVYTKVTTKGIESEELTVIPSTEQQIFDGLYNKVTVEKAELAGEITLPAEIPLNLGDYIQLNVNGNNNIVLLDSQTAIIAVSEKDNLLIEKKDFISIDYLEFTGTQYIKTNINLFSNTYSQPLIELDFEPTAFFDYNSIIGTVDGSTKFEAWVGKDTKLCFRARGEKISASLTLNERIKAKMYIGGTRNYYVYLDINDENIGSVYTVISYLNSPLTIGHRPTTSYFGKFKLYGCKLYNGDTLLADYIPTLDNNNVPSLYDKVSETYLYNAGTGNFLYG